MCNYVLAKTIVEAIIIKFPKYFWNFYCIKFSIIKYINSCSNNNTN